MVKPTNIPSQSNLKEKLWYKVLYALPEDQSAIADWVMELDGRYDHPGWDTVASYLGSEVARFWGCNDKIQRQMFILFVSESL
jgi:hypothetical protein